MTDPAELPPTYAIADAPAAQPAPDYGAALDLIRLWLGTPHTPLTRLDRIEAILRSVGK